MTETPAKQPWQRLLPIIGGIVLLAIGLWFIANAMPTGSFAGILIGLIFAVPGVLIGWQGLRN